MKRSKSAVAYLESRRNVVKFLIWIGAPVAVSKIYISNEFKCISWNSKTSNDSKKLPGIKKQM